MATIVKILWMGGKVRLDLTNRGKACHGQHISSVADWKTHFTNIIKDFGKTHKWGPKTSRIYRITSVIITDTLPKKQKKKERLMKRWKVLANIFVGPNDCEGDHILEHGFE